ncbi:hypothetical protein D3C87_1877930 [compost metagenome]
MAIWSNASFTVVASLRPASVISRPLCVRRNSVCPNCSSRMRTCRLTALSLTFKICAAFLTLVWAATTSKQRSAFSEGRRRSIPVSRAYGGG